MDWAVELRGVSKGFVLRHNPARNIKVRLIGMFHPRHREQLERFWALHEIDLLVRKGEWLGIIGPNGSGKSTLLRIIASIYRPTEGEVVVRGRVAPMIELGVGFQPGPDGAGERLPEHVALRPLQTGDRRDLPADRRVLRARGVHRGAGQELLHGDVRAPRVLHRRAPGAGHPLDRRGARRGRRALPAEVSSSAWGSCVVGARRSSWSPTACRRSSSMCDRVCLLVRGRLEAEGDPGKVVARYRELVP